MENVPEQRLSEKHTGSTVRDRAIPGEACDIAFRPLPTAGQLAKGMIRLERTLSPHTLKPLTSAPWAVRNQKNYIQQRRTDEA